MKLPTLLRIIHLWPPYLGAGVKVTHLSPDLRCIEVQMKLRFWNQNYLGTHFGGSLYSMVDPFFVLMLIENLGRDYEIWDKAASIRFKKPGKGTVKARFEIDGDQIEAIRRQADTEKKVEPLFTVMIRDESDEVIAQVEKLISVRRKERKADQG